MNGARAPVCLTPQGHEPIHGVPAEQTGPGIEHISRLAVQGTEVVNVQQCVIWEPPGGRRRSCKIGLTAAGELIPRWSQQHKARDNQGNRVGQGEGPKKPALSRLSRQLVASRSVTVSLARRCSLKEEYTSQRGRLRRPHLWT